MGKKKKKAALIEFSVSLEIDFDMTCLIHFGL